jgi:hypothetical protein
LPYKIDPNQNFSDASTRARENRAQQPSQDIYQRANTAQFEFKLCCGCLLVYPQLLRLVPIVGLMLGGLWAAMVSYLRLYTPRQRQATLTLVSATATGGATRCGLASSKGAFGLPRRRHAAGEALLAHVSRRMWSLWMVGRWLPFQLAFWGKALTGNRLRA